MAQSAGELVHSASSKLRREIVHLHNLKPDSLEIMRQLPLGHLDVVIAAERYEICQPMRIPAFPAVNMVDFKRSVSPTYSAEWHRFEHQLPGSRKSNLGLVDHEPINVDASLNWRIEQRRPPFLVKTLDVHRRIESAQLIGEVSAIARTTTVPFLPQKS